jgi:hypothetical protein
MRRLWMEAVSHLRKLVLPQASDIHLYGLQFIPRTTLGRWQEVTHPSWDTAPRAAESLQMSGGGKCAGAGRTAKSGDWSIFRPEIAFCWQRLGRKHGPVPFASGLCSPPGAGAGAVVYPL